MNIVFSSTAELTERQAWLAALRAAMPEARVVEVNEVTGAARAGDVAGPASIDPTSLDPASIEYAVVANPAPGALRGLPRLRLIQSLWAGVDRLLADPSLPPDVPIARMVDPSMTAAMAQTALWATLALHRGFFDYAQQQRARRWHQLAQLRSQDIHVVVLGFGQMGQATARSLAEQGYRVSGWRARSGGGEVSLAGGSNGTGNTDGAVVAAGADALAALLADARIVINLLPLTPATTSLIDARLLAHLPPGAALINLARGAHLVEQDLLAALDSGHLGRAVLDVFATEPLDSAHPFWTHPRISVLPHVAALTDLRSAAAVACANLRAVAAGGEPQHRVERARGY